MRFLSQTDQAPSRTEPGPALKVIQFPAVRAAVYLIPNVVCTKVTRPETKIMVEAMRARAGWWGGRHNRGVSRYGMLTVDSTIMR